MIKKCLLSLMVALVLALIAAGQVLATQLTEDLTTIPDLPLNNVTAAVCPGCPDGYYWHFVIAPNNGDSFFVEIHLNLGDGIHNLAFVPNGNQDDNVYVAVPYGYTLQSLQKDLSYAAIEWNQQGPQPTKFMLSSVCQRVPEPSTLLLIGTGLAGLALVARRRVRK